MDGRAWEEQAAREAGHPVDRTSIVTELTDLASLSVEDARRPQCESEKRAMATMGLLRLGAWYRDNNHRKGATGQLSSALSAMVSLLSRQRNSC